MNKSKKSSFSSAESAQSPLRFHSTPRSDLGDPPDTPPYASPSFYSSPEPEPEPEPDRQKPPPSISIAIDHCTQYSPIQSPPLAVLNRAVREEGTMPLPPFTKSQDRRHAQASAPAVLRSRESLLRVALGFRVFEFVLCLIAFSVMAADKTQGWSGDSFDRYKEYRYCVAVNVVAFVYSAFQAFNSAYYLMTAKPVILHRFHAHFDFLMDQILAYLLISASSSAATRVDDWKSNWGKDKFTEMATASVSMSFLAFTGFAASSLISGYLLFSPGDA